MNQKLTESEILSSYPLPDRKETLHILDTSFRFSLVHPITKARKEYQREGYKKILIDFDLSPASFVSLFYFSKLSLISSSKRAIYFARHLKQKHNPYRTYLWNLLKSFGIPSDHIFNLPGRATTCIEDLSQAAEKKKIPAIVLNDSYETFLIKYFHAFLSEGWVESLLPKEWASEERESTLLRPFRLLKNKDRERFCSQIKVPYIPICYSRGENKAAELISQLNKTYSPYTEKNIAKSWSNIYADKILGGTFRGKEVSFLNGYQETSQRKDRTIAIEGREGKALAKAEKEHRPLRIDSSL